MRTLIRLVLILIVLLVVGGVAFVVGWDAPAPTATMEKTIPDDRFPR